VEGERPEAGAVLFRWVDGVERWQGVLALGLASVTSWS
jgi:hypothetical protein